ncbi:BUD13 homolog isoform X2 [Dysidea avara]|uniref:BUD13 homolog isoform X2 n=1 Tax=Dysidea avara TaxID=196820 RepID=UPI0033336F57
MSYRHDFDSDLSPDKNQHKSHDIDHQTRPQGRGHRHDSDSDLSPERTGHKSHRITEDTKDRQEDRGHRHGSDYDLRGGHRVKTDDGRRQEEHNSDSDLSPERPAHQRSDSDPSPPRRHPTDDKEIVSSAKYSPCIGYV